MTMSIAAPATRAFDSDAFVRDERRGNPAVVKALPAVEDLLATGEFGLAHAGDDLDDFYLVVLERT